MKFWTILAFATVLAVAFVQAQQQRCNNNGGICRLKNALKGGCKKLPYSCKNQNAVCCQKNRGNTKGKRRKCKSPNKCKKEGGTCLRSVGGNEVSCDTITVDKLCKGKRCTCCLGDSKKCGTSSSCSEQGGICMKKNKSRKYCSTGTIDEDSCSGKCVCCIPDSGTGGVTQAPVSPTDCQCGQANGGERIVGGEEVTPNNKYPWMVGLVVPYLDTGYGCGGALINNLYVLTAGHCVYDPNTQKPLKAKTMEVGIGDHQQLTESEDISGVTRRVKVASYTVYPEYSFDGYDYDIALIKLRSPLDLTANSEVQSVCLPKDDENSYEGYDGIVSGWGLKDYEDPSSFNDELYEVTVPILDSDCTGYNPSNFDITETLLCAGFEEGGKDACSGDSGGPLVVNEDGVYTIVGIVSFGEGCAEPNKPGVYTRVSKFLDWIAENTKDASYCAE